MAPLMAMGYILGTGSRGAPEWLRTEVFKQLSGIARHAHEHHGVDEFTVVEGEADGVDKACRQWALAAHPWPVVLEPFRATWEADCDPARCTPGHRRLRPYGGGDYCPAQGVYRNGRMVDFVTRQYHENSAWVQVAAFYQTSNSTGTVDCVRQARAKHLSVLEFGNVPQAQETVRGPR